MKSAKATTMQLRDTKDIALGIPAGWQVCIVFTTQAGYAYKVTLKSGGQIVYDKARQSTQIEPIDTTVIDRIPEDTRLSLEVPASSNLDIRLSNLMIYDERNECCAISYTILTEDSSDNDYNDLMLHITAWKSRE